MSEFRKDFRYPDNTLYFNSGSMSLTPARVVDAVASEKQQYENNPTQSLFDSAQRFWEVQKNLAIFLDCRPQDLYLRQNVTFAINDFIFALKLPAKSEILVSDLEYGAITKICEHKAKLSGSTIRDFSFYDPKKKELVTEAELLNAVEQALSPSTKLVVLSHVMTGTGLKIPINKIGRMLRERGIFFVVDGAHGTGACKTDLDEKSLDYYGGNLHKWIMGPKGTGYAWVAPHMREHLEPQFAGWTTGAVPPHLSFFGDGDLWTQNWMICSVVNYADFYGINHILKYWSEKGRDKINQAQTSNLKAVEQAVSHATNWACLSNYTEDLRGPLVTFRLPMKLLKPGLMAELYKNHGLVVSTPFIRGETVLRLSPNIYNTEEEINRVAEILRGLA